MKNFHTIEELLNNLELINRISESDAIKKEAQNLLLELKKKDADTTITDVIIKWYEDIKEQYLIEQRDWVTKKGLSFRVSSFSD